MALAYHHHNTAEDVEGYLREAAAILERLDVPAELREEAYRKAIDLLSNKLAVGSPDVIPAGRLLNGG